MNEKVGNCNQCNKPVYCQAGFLQGKVQDDKTVLCFACAEADSKHNIRLKRIYEQPHPTDGKRVLVDRVWPRGVSKDEADLTEWMKDVAPSSELRKWFDHDPEKFAEFRSNYMKELKAKERASSLQQLKNWSDQGRVTIVYAAKDEKHNHAVVLKEVLTKSEQCSE